MGINKKKLTKMTEFCDFVPDDPSCQPDPVDPDVPSGGDGGGDGHHGEIDDWEDMKEMMGHNPMMGNLTYLQVAMGSAIMGALELFVWHEDDYYDDGEVLSSNTRELDVRPGHGTPRGGPGEVHGQARTRKEGTRRRDDGVRSEHHRLLHYLRCLLIRF